MTSLVDEKDVFLRNFARPVQAVALSPHFKDDRSYLSGGLAGNLILTTGGKAGVSENANTNSAAAAASGFLGSIGLGGSTGKDTVLHSGEGAISTIKWSLTGKYVAWVNEHGIKLMRSNLKLDGVDSEIAWKRLGHIDRPNRRGWEDMAGVWRARLEWVDEKNLEVDEADALTTTNGLAVNATSKDSASDISKTPAKQKQKKFERLTVGWGDQVWVIHVFAGSAGATNATERSVGKADIVH